MSVKIISQKMVVVSISSTLKNPCPSGTGIGYMYITNSTFLNNTILVVCSSSFNNNKNNNDDLAIGLGLGLGLGIPLVLIIVCLLVACRGNIYVPPPQPHPQPQPQQTPQEVEAIVRSELSPELYIQFAYGQLTNELKIALYNLRQSKGSPLTAYSEHAKNLNKEALAQWICDIRYTTLQDENIV